MTQYFRITEREVMRMARTSGHLIAVKSCLKAHGEDRLAYLAGKHSKQINKIAIKIMARDRDSDGKGQDSNG